MGLHRFIVVLIFSLLGVSLSLSASVDGTKNICASNHVVYLEAAEEMC